MAPQHIARYRDARMTKARTLKDGAVQPAKRATVAANRELALFSHIWNKAREWGYTAKTNPCAGVSKNKETPRDFYADDEVWQAVRAVAAQELRELLSAGRGQHRTRVAGQEGIEPSTGRFGIDCSTS